MIYLKKLSLDRSYDQKFYFFLKNIFKKRIVHRQTDVVMGTTTCNF